MWSSLFWGSDRKGLSNGGLECATATYGFDSLSYEHWQSKCHLYIVLDLPSPCQPQRMPQNQSKRRRSCRLTGLPIRNLQALHISQWMISLEWIKSKAEIWRRAGIWVCTEFRQQTYHIGSKECNKSRKDHLISKKHPGQCSEQCP